MIIDIEKVFQNKDQKLTAVQIVQSINNAMKEMGDVPKVKFLQTFGSDFNKELVVEMEELV